MALSGTNYRPPPDPGPAASNPAAGREEGQELSLPRRYRPPGGDKVSRAGRDGGLALSERVNPEFRKLLGVGGSGWPALDNAVSSLHVGSVGVAKISTGDEGQGGAVRRMRS